MSIPVGNKIKEMGVDGRLKNYLCGYYGYLRETRKTTHEWNDKRVLEKKIKALEVLLDIEL